MMSLMYLSQMLHEHHGVVPIIIDAYDTDMTMKGVKTVFKSGVAFSGKKLRSFRNSLSVLKENRLLPKEQAILLHLV